MSIPAGTTIEDADLSNVLVNSEEMFTITWEQRVNGTITNLESCTCLDLIAEWTDLSVADREQFSTELFSQEQICPNVTSFKTKGGFLSDT